MHFTKIETSDGETRWINLAQVVRATITREATSGEVVLAVTLSTDHGRPAIQIHGTDDVNRQAIDRVIHALEDLTVAPLPAAA